MASGVDWTFTQGKMVNGTFTADTDAAGADILCSYTLTKMVTLEDVTSQGTIVTSDEGITGYRFNVEDIKDQLNLNTTDASAGNYFPDGSVIYYWPTYSSGSIFLTDSTGTKEFTSMVSTATGSGKATERDNPLKYEGVEELLDDYSYTTITGEDLDSATSVTGAVFTEEIPKDAEIRYNMFGGNYSIVTPSADGFTLQFNTVDGTLTSVGGGSNTSQTLNLSKLTAAGYDGFQDVTIDFSSLLNYNNGGSNTAAMSGGDSDSIGKGKKLGAMTGMTVDQSGKIYASYDNGNTVLLGQIAVAQFANASGLEALGDNCYGTTLNSGEFDGIGVEIDADGSSITSGELEMSNVDLATEFTSMITTQRGFQANSRVITTSDSMLEELINLKR
jgi:flagellar hook protein FlgE